MTMRRVGLSMAFVLVAAAGAQQGPKTPAMAKIGAQASGYNYEYGVLCGAGPELLRAFKAKKQATFAAAGAAFETEFAAGRAATDASWKDLVSKVGEEKTKADLCKNGELVAKMQAQVAKP